MFKYKIIQKPDFFLDKIVIDKIFFVISQKVEKAQKGVLNIVFAEDNYIKELNKNYRKLDDFTDVLSFHYYEDFSSLKKDNLAGELIFSQAKIISQGEEYGLGEEKEFYKLLIHSILHILGYDHEKDSDYEVMNSLENIIWKEIFV